MTEQRTIEANEDPVCGMGVDAEAARGCARAQRERDDPTLHEYARQHVGRYQGTGRRGYREETRDEDRRLHESAGAPEDHVREDMWG